MAAVHTAAFTGSCIQSGENITSGGGRAMSLNPYFNASSRNQADAELPRRSARTYIVGPAVVHTPRTTVRCLVASMISTFRYFTRGCWRLICFACTSTRGISD